MFEEALTLMPHDDRGSCLETLRSNSSVQCGQKDTDGGWVTNQDTLFDFLRGDVILLNAFEHTPQFGLIRPPSDFFIPYERGASDV